MAQFICKCFHEILVGEPEYLIPAVKLKNKNIRLFIFTSKKASSSGEFVIASFAGQKNATIIGANAQGLTSDNSEFKLSDGTFLILTTGNLADRKEKSTMELERVFLLR